MVEKADLVIFRNTGPVIQYQEYFESFYRKIRQNDINTFNSFDGKADIVGKQYLLDLAKEGYAVIPTVEKLADINQLGTPDKYVVKPKNGADSIGMEILTHDELVASNPDGKLIQPLLDFKYEVSFYYLNDQFQYALYAPNKTKRWELQEYDPCPEDFEFADKFITWNNITTGITRVDACRLEDGKLLLVELEDLNPFLSIQLLPEEKRNSFIENWVKVLKERV